MTINCPMRQCGQRAGSVAGAAGSGRGALGAEASEPLGGVVASRARDCSSCLREELLQIP